MTILQGLQGRLHEPALLAVALEAGGDLTGAAVAVLIFSPTRVKDNKVWHVTATPINT